MVTSVSLWYIHNASLNQIQLYYVYKTLTEVFFVIFAGHSRKKSKLCPEQKDMYKEGEYLILNIYVHHMNTCILWKFILQIMALF